jgi:hypothetical protein
MAQVFAQYGFDLLAQQEHHGIVEIELSGECDGCPKPAVEFRKRALGGNPLRFPLEFTICLIHSHPFLQAIGRLLSNIICGLLRCKQISDWKAGRLKSAVVGRLLQRVSLDDQSPEARLVDQVERLFLAGKQVHGLLAHRGHQLVGLLEGHIGLRDQCVRKIHQYSQAPDAPGFLLKIILGVWVFYLQFFMHLEKVSFHLYSHPRVSPFEFGRDAFLKDNIPKLGR